MTLAKEIKQRIEMTGKYDAPTLHFVADILTIVATEASGWTNRCDDAMRIPDVIDEAANEIRAETRKAKP